MYTPYYFHQLFHQLTLLRLLRHSIVKTIGSTGISTCCPSATPVGLTLGPDLPRAAEPYPWKP